MASGSLTAAALRHRPGQAVLIVVLAGVVSASAALGPLYARAAEQSVLRTVLSEAPAANRGVVVTSSTNRPPSPQQLASGIGSVRPRGYGAPIGGADVSVTVRGFAVSGGSAEADAQLISRIGLCRHLVLVTGRCTEAPAGANAVLISQRNATTFDIGVGDQLRLTDANDPAVALTATVAGIYRTFDASGDYWFGRSANATIPPPRQGEASPTVLDAIFASWPTLDSVPFSQLRTHADLPLRIDSVDLRDLPALSAAAGAIDAKARALQASSVTALPGLIAASNDQREQARTVIPLLAIQLAVLGVFVLGFVCAAATEGRRPEVALARLRGQRSVGAAGLLLRELGLLVVVGAAAGGAVGWLVAKFATDRWLASGVELELRWPVLAAIAPAALAGVLAVLVTAAPTLRQPLASLLRRVPPRASALQVGLVEGALIAAAAAGEVTLLATSDRIAGAAGAVGAGSGGSQSPVALLAPGLLAIAGGLLLAQAVVPASGLLARRALRSGRVVRALAGTQVARRPALRRLIAIITVACALLVFAVDIWEVAARNRATRAGVENGAPVVLTVDAPNAGTLRSAVLGIDPRQQYATPVVTAVSGAPAGPRMTAVEPVAFARIASWGSPERRPALAALRKLDKQTVPSLRLTGERLQMLINAKFTAESDNLNVPPPPNPRPLHVVLHLLTTRGGRSFSVGSPSRLRQGSFSYDAAMPCADGCLLRGVEIDRDFGDVEGVKLKFAIERIRTGPRGEPGTDVDLGPASAAAWQPVPNDNGDEVVVDPKHPLSFTAETFGSFLAVQRGDVPVTSPALIAGDVLDREFGPTFPDPPALAPDVTGVEASYDVAGRITQVPRTGAEGVLVNLDLLDKTAPPTTQTSYAVWLAADDPRREGRLVVRLQHQGIVVTARDSVRDHQVALASEGATLALRLALLAGVVSLVLVVFVLLVGAATSSASRGRDLAGLRLVGVPARVVRAAAIREQVTVATLGTVAGVSLGLIAAQAALPRLPLFARPGPRLPVTQEPAWSAVGLAGATCLVLLVLVSVFVGRSLAASATPERVRQDR
jgi:putative ABC transport system permease protein